MYHLGHRRLVSVQSLNMLRTKRDSGAIKPQLGIFSPSVRIGQLLVDVSPSGFQDPGQPHSRNLCVGLCSIDDYWGPGASSRPQLSVLKANLLMIENNSVCPHGSFSQDREILRPGDQSQILTVSGYIS
jgi:hypothetical protein